MTYPSTGCQTCKLRRIKCDEVKPVCRRCTKAKRTCYGMKPGRACWVVHSENFYASGRKKRPRGPRSTPIIELNSKVDTIPRCPLVDLKTTAVLYYLHYHLQSPDKPANICKGMSDEFFPIWKAKSDCPLLDLAISSMALAVFSRTKQHLRAATEASSTYHQLLKTLRPTLSSLNNENVDTYLIVSFFMGRYENVVHRINHLNRKLPFTTVLQSFSHHDGAFAILKIWKNRLSHIQLATDIIKHSRRGLIRSALLRKLAIPAWMRDGSNFGEQGLDLEYDRIFVRFVNARRQLSVLLAKATSTQQPAREFDSTAEELTEETRNIDEKLQDWTACFPKTWYHRRHTLSTIHSYLTKGFYSTAVYSYASPAYAAIWIQYYATRMLVNSTRLQALELCQPNMDWLVYKQQCSECLGNIRSTGNDLASSMPYCLQRFTVADGPGEDSITLNTGRDLEPYFARLVAWPLGIASGLGSLDEQQRAWFRAELRCLGQLMGDRVLEDGDFDRWGF